MTKSVNSSFQGDPDLDAWLRGRAIGSFVLAGITTNHSWRPPPGWAATSGTTMWFALDATHTFVRVGPDSTSMTADELARATATNLHGEFATVVTSEQVLAALSGRRDGRAPRTER